MGNPKLEGLRKINLTIVLSFTSGRLFCDIGELRDFIDFLGRYTLDNYDLDYDKMREFIYHFYPQLRGVGKDIVFNSPEEQKKFIAEQKFIFGSEIELRPIFGEDVQLLHLSDSEKTK